jgi:hypothetical protein
MRDEIYSIVERLAALEGRIDTQASGTITESRQKKPALFNYLKRTDEMFSPGVSGVEFAEDTVEEDVLARVKRGLADYLKSAEDGKQDKTLIKKQKQDLDLKKKELRDRTLQTKDPAHVSDIEEDPTQGPHASASGGGSNSTYARESLETAPVKTVHIPMGEKVGLSGGGSVLVEIHGDERDGFCIKCAGKEMRSRFKTLDECQIALEMYMAHRRAKHESGGTDDYIEEA